ncbi:MAG: hypothetical protein RR482_10735, partial [Clostridia bacterium]
RFKKQSWVANRQFHLSRALASITMEAKEYPKLRFSSFAEDLFDSAFAVHTDSKVEEKLSVGIAGLNTVGWSRYKVINGVCTADCGSHGMDAATQ